MFESIKKLFIKEKESKNPATENLPNYNDQLDGYGAGEAESNDPVTHEKKTKHPAGVSELGIPNPYGEIDQYSFRDTGRIPLKKRKEIDEDTP